MLRDLSIKNFAIIDDLQIRFDAGLTIMSGETGAGKSIIINAVKLLLGGRATAKLIRTGAETAELEAFFELAPSAPAREILKDQGYGADEGLLVRRLISRQERHRILINGRMATMQILQAVTENLASISSQHAHQSLLKDDFHLDVLDHFGNLMKQRAAVGAIFREIVPLLEKREALVALQARQNEQRELLQFQRAEIEAVQPEHGEDEQLEQERRRLRNAQTLIQTGSQCLEALYSGQDSVTDRLGEIRRQLETAAAIDDALQAPSEQVADMTYQLEDVVEGLRRYLGHVEDDEHRLEAVEARLDVLNRIKRKYGATLEAVIDRYERIQADLEDLESLTDQIDALDDQLAACHARLAAAARDLHDRR